MEYSAVATGLVLCQPALGLDNGDGDAGSPLCQSICGGQTNQSATDYYDIRLEYHYVVNPSSVSELIVVAIVGWIWEDTLL